MQSYLLKKEFFASSQKTEVRDHFQFLHQLGKGAYGVVYLARQHAFPHQLRVIKRISKRKLKDPSILLRELRVGALLDHPNILRTYETFEDESSVFLVLDFCEGGELYERLRGEKVFSEGRARELFRQMASAVRYMHGRRVAHRDLKLENFMMANKESWQIKLIDFGLSFQWDQDMATEVVLAEQGRVVGTPYYMAPEVLEKHYSEKCDIWSLGVILYMLVTGTPPFDGEDDQGIYKSVQSFNYSFQTKESKGLSPQVKNLIAGMLRPEAQRISFEELQKHPWMSSQSEEVDLLLHLQFSKLVDFSTFSKLKKVVMTYMATQMSEREIETLRDLFKSIDTDEDGFLTVEQLRQFLSSQEEESGFGELGELVGCVDTDRNGRVNYNEFIAVCLDEATVASESYLRFVFDSFDLNGDGKIQKEELDVILKASDFDCNEGLVRALIVENDTDTDGVIDFNEFRNAVRFAQQHSL